MLKKLSLASIAATAALGLCTTAFAADPTLTKEDGKDLKTQSEAQYKARKNVAEANEDLAKGDCKSDLEGSAKRACNKAARASAKRDKAAAKVMHEKEEQQIKDATKTK
jgi:hypothetical protein